MPDTFLFQRVTNIKIVYSYPILFFILTSKSSVYFTLKVCLRLSSASSTGILDQCLESYSLPRQGTLVVLNILKGFPIRESSISFTI